ncbi:MAG: hypothetical protein U0354_03355 [Candidatus Sericytochromatia bacterium]
MSEDNKNSKKKLTDDYMSGLGSGDSYIKMPAQGKVQKAANFSISDKQEVKKEPVEVKKEPVMPKVPEKKPEPPKVVVPKFIKKDSELEKEIVKIIQEVPKEELERILKPTKADKERLSKMDFQSRDDMSEAEKKDFIEQISKREPEPEVAQMNGALVWKWQKNRRMDNKK